MVNHSRIIGTNSGQHSRNYRSPKKKSVELSKTDGHGLGKRQREGEVQIIGFGIAEGGEALPRICIFAQKGEAG